MAESGDWTTPRLDGKPWLEKPPLLYWMSAIGYGLGFGPEAAPRVFPACASIAFILWYGWFLRRWMSREHALLAATILATSAGWIAYSNVAVTDVPMSICFTVGMLLALAWIETGSLPLAALAGVFFGFAMLGKGLVPVVLAAPLAWFARGRWRQWPVPIVTALLVAAPWYVAITQREGWAFIDEFFLEHHFSRFATNELQHQQPFWFYIPVIIVLLLPWTPWLYRAPWRDPKWRFFVAWAAAGFLFFSIATNKLPGYLMPLLPALAVLLALAFDRESRLPYWLAGGMVILVLGLKLFPPSIIQPTVNAASLARVAPDDACFDNASRGMRYGLHYYLRRPLLDCWQAPGAYKLPPLAEKPSGPMYEITQNSGRTLAGRLLVFASTHPPAGDMVLPVASKPEDVWIASRDVLNWKSGQSIRLDPAGSAFPGPIRSVASGRWHFTVLFDPTGDFPYYGPTPDDLRSDTFVIAAFDTKANAIHKFQLRRPVGGPGLPRPSIEFQSDKLSRFHREPVVLRADVIPGTSKDRVIVMHAHGESYARSRLRTILTAAPRRPTLVFVHAAHKYGHHAFADSDTNGPWSAALIEELLPRLGPWQNTDLLGEGLGGWGVMNLKQRFPGHFRNAWALRPDPLDFRNFFGIDLTARPVQIYKDAKGKRLPFAPGISIEESAIRETVLGLNGGQWESWDAIFSLRSTEGVSVELFGRADGRVNPAALDSWLQHNLAAKPMPREARVIQESELGAILQSK